MLVPEDSNVLAAIDLDCGKIVWLALFVDTQSS